MLYRTPVTVTTIYRDENEVAAARGGENLRLRLSGVDEDDIQAGFVICSRNCPVSTPPAAVFQKCEDFDKTSANNLEQAWSVHRLLHADLQ